MHLKCSVFFTRFINISFTSHSLSTLWHLVRIFIILFETVQLHFYLNILYKVLTGSLSMYVYIPKNGLNCYSSACSHNIERSLAHLSDINTLTHIFSELC